MQGEYVPAGEPDGVHAGGAAAAVRVLSVGVRCVPAEDILPGRRAQGGAGGVGVIRRLFVFGGGVFAGGEHGEQAVKGCRGTCRERRLLGRPTYIAKLFVDGPGSGTKLFYGVLDGSDLLPHVGHEILELAKLGLGFRQNLPDLPAFLLQVNELEDHLEAGEDRGKIVWPCYGDVKLLLEFGW